jgi:hypothetical protein
MVLFRGKLGVSIFDNSGKIFKGLQPAFFPQVEDFPHKKINICVFMFVALWADKY